MPSIWALHQARLAFRMRSSLCGQASVQKGHEAAATKSAGPGFKFPAGCAAAQVVELPCAPTTTGTAPATPMMASIVEAEASSNRLPRPTGTEEAAE